MYTIMIQSLAVCLFRFRALVSAFKISKTIYHYSCMLVETNVMANKRTSDFQLTFARFYRVFYDGKI